MNTFSVWVARTLVIFIALFIGLLAVPYGLLVAAGILAMMTPPVRR